MVVARPGQMVDENDAMERTLTMGATRAPVSRVCFQTCSFFES
jgi:hypothetical protein